MSCVGALSLLFRCVAAVGMRLCLTVTVTVTVAAATATADKIMRIFLRKDHGWNC